MIRLLSVGNYIFPIKVDISKFTLRIHFLLIPKMRRIHVPRLATTDDSPSLQTFSE